MGLFVIGCHKGPDVRPKLIRIPKTRPTQRLQRQNPEPNLNHVQPTRTGRRGVKKHLRMAGLPGLMPLVNAVIVHNHVIFRRLRHRQAGQHFFQKGQKPLFRLLAGLAVMK